MVWPKYPSILLVKGSIAHVDLCAHLPGIQHTLRQWSLWPIVKISEMDLTLHIFTPGWRGTYPHPIYCYKFNSGAFLSVQQHENVLHRAAFPSLLVGKRLIYSKRQAIMLMQGADSKQVACSIMDSNTQPIAWGPIKEWLMWTFWNSCNKGGVRVKLRQNMWDGAYLYAYEPSHQLKALYSKKYIPFVD